MVEEMARAILGIFAVATALVGIAMLRNRGSGEDRLFWRTFGTIALVLAGAILRLAFA